jgi:hypothetical protein
MLKKAEIPGRRKLRINVANVGSVVVWEWNLKI